MTKKLRMTALLLALCLCLSAAGCGSGGEEKSWVLDEETFFLVMTNMQYYPEQYLGAKIEYDCFTYALEDVDGVTHLCGVRKCSSGYGCTCGSDTIIGFILESDSELPAPKNQSEDSNDKTWVHLSGELKSAEKETVTIHAYLADGTVDPDKTEQIVFLVYSVDSCSLIDDPSGLHYYVTT